MFDKESWKTLKSWQLCWRGRGRKIISPLMNPSPEWGNFYPQNMFTEFIWKRPLQTQLAVSFCLVAQQARLPLLSTSNNKQHHSIGLQDLIPLPSSLCSLNQNCIIFPLQKLSCAHSAAAREKHSYQHLQSPPPAPAHNEQARQPKVKAAVHTSEPSTPTLCSRGSPGQSCFWPLLRASFQAQLPPTAVSIHSLLSSSSRSNCLPALRLKWMRRKYRNFSQVWPTREWVTGENGNSSRWNLERCSTHINLYVWGSPFGRIS